MPSKIVIARPVMVTRSPSSSTLTRPDREDACSPTSDVCPSRSTQNGANTVCALPVTGSSGMPRFGAKRRETKSYSLPGIGDSSDDHGGGIESADCGEVWVQAANGALVGDEGQEEDLVVGTTRPFNWHTDRLGDCVSRLDLGGRPGGKVHRQKPSGRWLTVSRPLRVANRNGPCAPSSTRQWAEASVAWPQRSISTIGVNQRSRKSASGSSSRMTNPVSGTPVSRATAANHSSDGASSRNSTAAGFPVNGLSVNASTVLNRTLATP